MGGRAANWCVESQTSDRQQTVRRASRGLTQRRKMLVVAALFLLLGVVTGCSDPDQESCNNLYGGGYLPKTEHGQVYCENPWNGNRYLLRDE